MGAIGGIIDGCPAGVKIDQTTIQQDLDRRKPGQSKIVSQRKENDIVEIFLEFLTENLLEHQLVL